MFLVNFLRRTWELAVNTWRSGRLGKGSAIGIVVAPILSYGSLGLSLSGFLPGWIPAMFFLLGNFNSFVLAPTLVGWHNGGKNAASYLRHRLAAIRLPRRSL